MINPFFKNKGPFNIEKLLNLSEINNSEKFSNDKIFDIKDLTTATNKDITFFHSSKYVSLASKTKALFCITTKNLENFLPKTCRKIIVSNVLIATAKITKSFYPNSVVDDFDQNVEDISKTIFKIRINGNKQVYKAYTSAISSVTLRRYA